MTEERKQDELPLKERDGDKPIDIDMSRAKPAEKRKTFGEELVQQTKEKYKRPYYDRDR